MAAGMGSRFGGGIKQLEQVGPNGEIIMDYSIYDAKQAGFDRVVFIIRKDIEKAFREIIGNRIEQQIEAEYVFQELDDLPAGFVCPTNRTKPWGTGQAVLSCLGKINEPFLVINADDYYGKEAFIRMHEYLVEAGEKQKKGEYCMAGFVLGNTLSDNGAVTRGICDIDASGKLKTVHEVYQIKQSGDAASGADEDGNLVTLPLNTHVSMNMWGFTPEFLTTLETGFHAFLKENLQKEKAEYLLPGYVGELLEQGKISVQMLPTKDRWFGVTYKEDKEKVVKSLEELIRRGEYPNSLY